MKLSNAKDAFLLHYFSEKKRARKTLLAYEADLQQFLRIRRRRQINQHYY